MGYSNWSDAAFERVRTERAGSTSAEIFRKQNSVDPLMDPRRIEDRVARDSEHHPRSLPIIVAFDVTASMGYLPTRFATELLGSLMRSLVEGGLAVDPQVLFAAVGDAVSDRGPLQVGQFESGLEMDEWLTRIWLECNGGDAPESYQLVHWFAARHTSTDSMERRAHRGWLFTIGDATNKPLRPSHIRRVFGAETEEPTDEASVLDAARVGWNVRHLIVNPSAAVVTPWQRLMGKHALPVPQVDSICDVMGAIIGAGEGTLSAEDAKQRLTAAGIAPNDAEGVVG